MKKYSKEYIRLDLMRFSKENILLQHIYNNLKLETTKKNIKEKKKYRIRNNTLISNYLNWSIKKTEYYEK